MRAVTGELAGEGIYGQFFHDAQIFAAHLEVQDTYHVPDEYEPLARWRETGEIFETEGSRQWCAMVKETVARGVSVRRLRVVTVPHSEYTRWLLDACAPNVAAGEQIRWLPRHLAEAAPEDDFWLFDGRLVAFNTVDDVGGAEGLAVTTDPAIADVCAAAWERLWSHGIDHEDYRAEYGRR